MLAESRNNATKDEQSLSAAPSEVEAASEAELEAANDYYRRIVAARSTESQIERIEQANRQSSPAQDEEDLIDLSEVELGESAASRMGVPDCNQSSPTILTTDPIISDTEIKNDVAQVVSGPILSKSQKKRRRQGRKRRAMARLREQEHLQPSLLSFDTQDRGKNPSMTSTTNSDMRDTEATADVRLINDQAERHPWTQTGRQYRDHSTPRASQFNMLECGQGLSKTWTLTSSRPLPEAQRTCAPSHIEIDLNKSHAKHRGKASLSDGGLPCLPIEIQLQILEACVVNSRTCIELIAGQTYHQFCDHNGVALGILRTCRLYWEEGSKIFRERNDFTLRSFQAGPAFSSSLRLYSKALPNLKHLTLRYTTLGCSNCSIQAVADFSRTVRLMPTLESLDIELESRWDWDCTDANNGEHCLPSEEAFKDFYEKGYYVKADQCRLRHITLSGRSWINEMRTVTLSGEPCSDLAPILAERLLPALSEVRFGRSGE